MTENDYQRELKNLAERCFPQRYDDEGKPKGRKCDIIALTNTVIEKFHPVVMDKNIYIYVSYTGLYIPDGENRRIIAFIIELANAVEFQEKLAKIRSEVITRVLNNNLSIYNYYPFDDEYAIGFANGVLVFSPDGKSYELKPYSHEYKLTHKFNVWFNPDADRTLFEKTLGYSWVGFDNIEKLYHPLAASILQAMPSASAVKRAYFIHGPGNSGKSTYCELLKSVTGSENVGGLSFQQICDPKNRFDRYTLIGKFINVGEEVSAMRVSDINEFKVITGNLTHAVEDKGKTKINAKIPAVHLYTVNRFPQLPKEVQDDYAFWNRIEILEFQNYFETDSSWGRSGFAGEIRESFILNVIDCVQKYWKGLPKRTEEEIQETRIAWVGYAKSPFQTFLEDMTEHDPKTYIPKDELRCQYELWASDENASEDSKEIRRKACTNEVSVGREAINAGLIGTKHTINGKKGVPCYEGIRWKHSAKYHVEDRQQTYLTEMIES